MSLWNDSSGLKIPLESLQSQDIADIGYYRDSPRQQQLINFGKEGVEIVKLYNIFGLLKVNAQNHIGFTFLLFCSNLTGIIINKVCCEMTRFINCKQVVKKRAWLSLIVFWSVNEKTKTLESMRAVPIFI